MARANHRNRIYDLLIHRIQTGEVGWEDRLVDATLAAELGVSRMPARDALLHLAAEGYLVPTTRGFTLPRLERQDVIEVFELRRLLEPRAAALAAQSMTEASAAAMRAAVQAADEAAAAGQSQAFIQASEAFRESWLSVVPRRALVDTIRRYFVQVQNVRFVTMRGPENLAIAATGLRDLAAAHLARDGVAAADIMLRVIIEGEAAYRAATEPGDGEAERRSGRKAG